MNVDYLKKVEEMLSKKATMETAVFQTAWQHVLDDLKSGNLALSAQNTSRLNNQLELLRIIEKALPNLNPRSDEEIVKLVVFDAKNVGDHVAMPDQNASQHEAKIIRREITERFGILYTFETPDGTILSREFFD